MKKLLILCVAALLLQGAQAQTNNAQAPGPILPPDALSTLGNITIAIPEPVACYQPGQSVTMQFSGVGYSPGNTYTVHLLKQASATTYYIIQVLATALPYTAGPVSFTLSSTIPAGIYVLHIHGNTNLSCGGYDESPQITICAEEPVCTCNKWNSITMTQAAAGPIDNPVGAVIVPNPLTDLKCGKQYTVKCNEKYIYAFDYKCKPVGCNATYDVKVTDPAGNTIVYTNVNAAAFAYSFLLPGVYTFTIIPNCGDNSCKPCVIKFITNCADCCKELLKTVTDIKPFWTGNLLTFSTGFSTTQPVQSIEATIISLQSTRQCPPAAANTTALPVIINAANCIGYAQIPVYSGEHHFTNGTSTNPSPVIQLQLPPLAGSNCSEQVKVCVRYLLRYADCKTCEVVRCYTIKRKGKGAVDIAENISRQQ